MSPTASSIGFGLGQPMPLISADHSPAQQHLSRRDHVLKRLIRKVGPCTLRCERNRFAALARPIISQQISTVAARAIRARVEAALDGKGLTAAGVLSLSDDAL